LTSSVSCFPLGLWAKSLARLKSDATGRSLREGRGPRPRERRRRRRHPWVSHTLDPAAIPRTRGDAPPAPDGPGSSGLLADGSGPVDPELLAERGDVVADGGKEVRGVDGSGQLIPLDLGPDRILQFNENVSTASSMTSPQPKSKPPATVTSPRLARPENNPTSTSGPLAGPDQATPIRDVVPGPRSMVDLADG
jgi:hypothetical protein